MVLYQPQSRDTVPLNKSTPFLFLNADLNLASSNDKKKQSNGLYVIGQHSEKVCMACSGVYRCVDSVTWYLFNSHMVNATEVQL
jgi:hypothetical protein